MIKSYTIYSLLLINLFLLCGCGFKLRTAESLPPQLHRLYYQTNNPYGQFEVVLKRALKSSGITLLAAPNKTAPILSIASNYNYSTTSSISTGEGRVYMLNYSATISISDTNSKILLSPQSVSISRNITLQPNEVFEITPQVEIAKQEMRQELSFKILNILCAKKTFQIFTKVKNH